MSEKIKVSRHGLTRCPSCAAHIQLGATTRATVCPFCQTSLTSLPPTPPTKLNALIHGALSTGRSGLLAAGLLGLSVAACSEEESPKPSDDTTSGASDTSGTSNTDPDTTTAPDVTSGDVYGLPADTDTVDEDIPVAEYGLPPDPDATDATDDAEEDIPTAEYGIPPSP